MGGPLSVTFANIYMTKLENDCVKPLKPNFYKRYVDDIISKRKIGVADPLLSSVSNYHNNINFTVEQKPKKFLDTAMEVNSGKVKTTVYRKPNKYPSHWSSKVPKKYKRNSINTDLSRAKRISSEFNDEKRIIREKYTKAGYPIKFTNSVIKQFQDKQNQLHEQVDELLIPEWFFEEKRTLIMIELPFCNKNEITSKCFLHKLKSFTLNKVNFTITWSTNEIKNLFKIKDRNPHPSCCIYKGTCSCSMVYIGETKRNATV